MPLSKFFLQLSGETGDGAEKDKRDIRGYRIKRDGEGEDTSDKNRPLGKINFGGTEAARTRAGKAARPKAKPRKPLPTRGEDEEEDFEESRAPFTGSASKPQKCHFCDAKATKSMIWAEGRAYIPCCDKHEKEARSKIEDDNDDEVTYVRKIDETFSGNIATVPRPIGRPIRKMGPKARKRWVESLTKLGT